MLIANKMRAYIADYLPLSTIVWASHNQDVSIFKISQTHLKKAEEEFFLTDENFVSLFACNNPFRKISQPRTRVATSDLPWYYLF